MVVHPGWLRSSLHPGSAIHPEDVGMVGLGGMSPCGTLRCTVAHVRAPRGSRQPTVRARNT